MAGARPDRLLGSEVPRVFTPPLRELTPETTLGFDAIEFCEQVLGVAPRPWQRWFLIHALELGEDDLLRFRKIVLLVARQNGKTLISELLALYFIYALGARLVLGTAQDLTTAEDIWQDTFDIAAESDLLGPLLTKPKLGKGSKEFGLIERGTYRVKAANRRGGRGSRQVKLVLLSETREQQTWDAWGAITKTTNAVEEALVLCESNAGDASSVVLRHLRMMAHKALGDPDGICADADPMMLLDAEMVDEAPGDDSLAIFEWSAPPGVDIQDREGWAWANPSLGHGIAERTLASDAASDKEWVFRTEVLCQWADGSLTGPFPPGAWEAGRYDQEEADADPIVGDVVACVDVSWDRRMVAVAYAGRREGGDPLVEVVLYRYDPAQALAWLTSDARTVLPTMVVLRENGPAKPLRDGLEQAGLTVLAWSGADVSDACGQLYDLVLPPDDESKCGPLRHAGHTALDVAAGVALTRPYGDRWSWDLAKSPVDVSPLYAVTGALWGLGRPKEQVFVSAYETRGLMTI